MRTWGQSKISSYCICACLLLRLKSRSTKGHLTIQLLWAAAQILVTRFLPCLPSGRVLLCVWCESGELEGRTSSRFSCVTPVVETFSSDRVAFRTSSNISDGTPLQKQQKSSKYRLFPEKKLYRRLPIGFEMRMWLEKLRFYYLLIFFYFTSFTVDLKLLVFTKKYLHSLYSNKIESINVNSVDEQEMHSFPKKFLKSMWTNWQTHTHLFSHLWSNNQRNASIPVQWVFWCSLYKSYMLQIFFTKLTRTLQRHPFFNFSFKNT